MTPISASAAARATAVETIFRDLRGNTVALLPQHVGIVGPGATTATYPLTAQRIFSAEEAGTLYGFGSPIHLAALGLLPPNGDGVKSVPITVYPLADGTTPSTGNVLPVDGGGGHSGTATYTLRVAGVEMPFTLVDGDSVAEATAAITAAVGASLNTPVTATDNSTDVDLEAKWGGTSGDDIVIEVIGGSNGITWTITPPTGGAGDSDVDPGLALIADTWATQIVNAADSSTATLDKYSVYGEGRWDGLTKKPLMVWTGTNETVVATLVAAGDARKTDRVNGYVTVPGSPNHPFQIAARGVARIALQADVNPPVDYAATDPLTGLVAGASSDQFTYAERDQLVKAGISTTVLVDGVPRMEDTVTFHHPDGQDPPAHRYAVDNVKLQNTIYNLTTIFEAPEWAGAPLLPDSTPTTNRAARKPRDAKAAVNSMIDGLALEAIISDPETAKENTTADIDGGNPKRLNVVIVIQLSGNTNIIAVELNFGFFFGQAIAA